MAEMLDSLKNKLQSLLEIKYDETHLSILIDVKGESQKSDILAEPQEVKDMLRIYGGLTDEIFMKIEIDNEARNIKLTFQNKADLEKVKGILIKLWENIIHIFKELEKGNNNILRGLGDFSD